MRIFLSPMPGGPESVLYGTFLVDSLNKSAGRGTESPARLLWALFIPTALKSRRRNHCNALLTSHPLFWGGKWGDFKLRAGLTWFSVHPTQPNRISLFSRVRSLSVLSTLHPSLHTPGLTPCSLSSCSIYFSCCGRKGELVCAWLLNTASDV